MKKFEWGRIQYGEAGKDKPCYHAYYGGRTLGYIEFYDEWKCWVWNQGEDIIMSLDCIKHVEAKLHRLKNVK